jgi:cytochrome P450
MTDATLTADDTLLRQVADYASRANPYPLFAELRKTPVARQHDGVYAVSTYAEIMTLLHDPRISSDLEKRPGGSLLNAAAPAAFINTDPPVHDRLRRMATRHFGPPHSPDLVASFEPMLHERVEGLIDAMEPGEIDIVDQLAYPFPVAAICEILGVPHEDEPRFHAWSSALISAIGARFEADEDTRDAALAHGAEAFMALREYLDELAKDHAQDPGDDLISRLATDDGPDGRMTAEEIQATAQLLLVAGHETTVNLISNGMLELLRAPELLERVATEPEFVISVVEELLRYQPPVQMVPNRSALEDIDIAGTTIPAGSAVTLLPAAGNRDPSVFADPDRFDPDRPELQHLGFGGGIHYCFGSPLARLEVQIALSALARRLQNPRLIEDPPPYRPSPVLRGPLHLRVQIDGVRAAEPA